MKQRKGGYCNLTKLWVETTDKITKQKVEKEIIDPTEIRSEAKKFYQKIFNRQEVKKGTDAIDEFLNSMEITIHMMN